MHTVSADNGCQNKTCANGKNDRKVFKKDKTAFTVCMNDKNPVQTGHNAVISPAINNLNPVVVHSVGVTSTDCRVGDVKWGDCAGDQV